MVEMTTNISSVAMILLICLLSLLAISMAKVPQLVLPNCDEKCGDLTIPYPFGFREGCFKDPSYRILCKQDGNTFKAHLERKGFPGGKDLPGGDDEILNISLSTAEVIVMGKYLAYNCFNDSGEMTKWKTYTNFLENTSFVFSATRNKIIGIGCDTVAYLSSIFKRKSFTSGCVSACNSLDSVTNGSCSGIGCCQSSIPLGLKSFYVRLDTYFIDHSTISEFNPCSFAFVADKDWFNFDISSLSAKTFGGPIPPVVLDWAIGNQTCEQESRPCGPNSNCSNSIHGPGFGYQCNCKAGFEDIDECEKGFKNECHQSSICTNTLGSYNCSCPKGYNGDGFVKGTGCAKSPNTYISIVAGTCAGVLVLPVFIWFWYEAIKERKRRKFFEKNGGILLRKQIGLHQREGESFKFFKEKELKIATKHFEEIFRGGEFGKVSEGELPSGKDVVVRRPKKMDPNQIIQFIDEVDILSQSNHDHVIKLLGVCLENDVPMLVYEFFSRTTLFDRIHHGKNLGKTLSWKDRLRIATETAKALAYLHHSHPVSIFHRNLKSSTVLVNDENKAKISDFGASGFIPVQLDEAHQSTLTVQGNHGYLDPEYYGGELNDKCYRADNMLTEGSDVYSFGVVLVELLTGEEPIMASKETLAEFFLSSVKDEKLVLDVQIKNDGKKEQFMKVAELAISCLQAKSEDRPTMKQIVKQLDSIKNLFEQPSFQHNQLEETEHHRHGEPSTSSITDEPLEIDIGR
ncbi:wall-associated receptor kinase 4-like isoform X2 [Macadamia integrifolia]|uniref:wall-associated receptor kinase 4-like isoform X2 n=1 Tax=Macadamia integrifolia TaxID=60698 RepID=UPI001C4E5E90|nr:wall-associated receptor kinase 4-like isoform X2 [Macadamia integrifolia]